MLRKNKLNYKQVRKQNNEAKQEIKDLAAAGKKITPKGAHPKKRRRDD